MTKSVSWVLEMAQWLREPAILVEDQSLLLSIHTIAYNHLHLCFQRIWHLLLAAIGTRHTSSAHTYVQAKHSRT